MNRDKASAGLILIAVAIYGAVWYYRRKNAFQGTTVSSPIGGVSIDVPQGVGTKLDTWKPPSGFAPRFKVLPEGQAWGEPAPHFYLKRHVK